MTMIAPVRRLRHARPDPRVRRLGIGEADYAIFRAIERHGPLPSSYLYEFTRHLRRDKTHLQNRLTEFYNGDEQGSLLSRPPQQFAGYRARYQHLVYDLTRRSRVLLAERDGQDRHDTARNDPFVHRLMCACVGASFELAASRHGLRYISFNEILGRPGAANSRDAANPLALPVRVGGMLSVIPDIVFGLEYPRNGFRFFAVECDRNTESIERRSLKQSAFGRKLLAYDAVLDTQSYRDWWGIPNLHVLTLTTSARHARNILGAIARDVDPHRRTAFALSACTMFGANWSVPDAPLRCLLDGPWQSVDGHRNFSVA